MYRIIGGDQKEYGPVSAEDIRRWIAEGRASAQTSATAEEITDWKPLATFPEFAAALQAQPAPPPAAGGAIAPADTSAWTAQILARPAEVRMGDCLGRSWTLLTGNFATLFGATAIAWFISLVCQFIPLIGGIVLWLIQGVLYGGLYLVFLNRIRGRPGKVSDVFAGFSAGFAQLMLVGVLTKLLTSIGLCCCLVLPGLYLFVAWVFSVPLVADRRLEFWSAMELSRKVITRVWFQMLALLLVAFLPAILIYVFMQVYLVWTSYPLMQDLMSSGSLNLEHLQEIVLHVTRVGLPLTLLFKVVLLLNLPFALGALMYAYEGLFGARTAPTA